MVTGVVGAKSTWGGDQGLRDAPKPCQILEEMPQPAIPDTSEGTNPSGTGACLEKANPLACQEPGL
eukprot:1481396-Alexandrium_andersonii.AAC.1